MKWNQWNECVVVDTKTGHRIIARVLEEGPGSFNWRHYVAWNGYVVKKEWGFVCVSDARTAAEHWIREILAGRVEEPWRAYAERERIARVLEEIMPQAERDSQ